VAEFDLSDYIKMQNQIYMDEKRDCGPYEDVVVYADEKDQKVLHFWYSPADQPIVDRCITTQSRAFFVKAYSDYTGRDGINIQTGTIDFTDFGYGPNSTVAMRRLIALHANDWTLQFLQDNGLDIFPKDDNHLDLRRDNLVVGRTVIEWDQQRRLEYSLTQAKIWFNKKGDDDEETTT